MKPDSCAFTSTLASQQLNHDTQHSTLASQQLNRYTQHSTLASQQLNRYTQHSTLASQQLNRHIRTHVEAAYIYTCRHTEACTHHHTHIEIQINICSFM